MAGLIAQLQASRATSTSLVPFLARVVAGPPLFLIGIVHIINPDAPVTPINQALGLPFPEALAAVAIAAEIVSGASLLLGAWARVGALIALPTMAVAFWAHVALEVWPNPNTQPPFALPLVIIAAAIVVLWLGAGRWSLDLRATGGQALASRSLPGTR